MSSAISDDELHNLAWQRVKDKREFIEHFVIYAVVSIILVIVWAVQTDVDHPWFVWAVVPWGIGVVAHFLRVFMFPAKKASEKVLEKRADKIAGRKRGFYKHLGLYLLVNAGIIAVWAGTGAESEPVPWFVYPLVGWGLFVLWNFVEAFKFPEEMAFEKRQFEKEVERLTKGGN